MGTTQFSDLTKEEFISAYLTLQKDESLTLDSVYEDDNYVSDGSVDWRQQSGVSTHVKN